ncbi:MAG: TonB-dependent receptor plug domain-containing protein [Cryomorphaceae bacterium]|jgi:hypothetical protein|nr:TonB-dependent receptor plug domain-containing protein [Cryomorphaceae bacterium]
MRHFLLYPFLITTVYSFAQIPDTTLRDTSQVIQFSITADDLESDAQNQDISTLLQSTRDVFASTAGFNFSNARYQIRGLESDHYSVLINGVPMNDPELGWGIFSFWGGLNDVTRYPEAGIGLGASNYTFSGVGGYTNMDMRASEDRSGTRMSYASTNRTYRNRIMITHSSGLLNNGWAFTVSGSYRWAQEGYVDGTYFNGGSYFLSVEKKINPKHSLGLVAFGAPTIQGRAGIAVQETFDLTGNNYYNPFWGYQTDGESGNQVKRNARERNNHRPSVFLNHYWKPNSRHKVNTALYATFGRTGNTNLNWYDAPDPRPDYYRNLPSYYADTDPNTASALSDAWSNDPSVSQIDWDAIYNANYKNLYTQENANGVAGNNVTFNRSKYIVEEYRIDPLQFGFNSIHDFKWKDNLMLTTGLNIDRYVSRNFKVLTDLLGGDHWVDVDQFAEQTFLDPTLAQNNSEVPNKLISEGDKFGYNYNMHVNTHEMFSQLRFMGKKTDAYGAVNLSQTTFFREGIWQNGRFENSGGIGEKHSFFNYGLKGGITYKITGRHFLTLNAIYQTRAPFSRNVYVSPRTRDNVVQGMKSMEIISGDLNYVVRYPGLRARATAYYTMINDGTYAQSFYHEEFRNFVNYTMTNVDQLYSGIELGIEKMIGTDWVTTFVFGTGQFLYNSRPQATITIDNSSEVVAEGRTVYLKNYHLGGMPQTAASIGLKYNSPKFWFAGCSFNYFTDIYIDPNPDRRTAEAVEKYVEDDPQWDEIVGETVIHRLSDNPFFDNNYTLDIFGGASFKIKGKILRVSATINNALNNTNFISGGFEQLRYDSNNINKFPPKYGFMYGTSYFLMLTYQL